MGIERISEFWHSWKPLELLGKGGNGEVYKCIHEEMGVKTYSAIKVINISSRQMETFTFNTGSVRSFCRNLITDCVNEINVMLSLKSCPNIVAIEDFKVIENVKDEEWEIFIRMELLTCLTDYLRDRVLTQDEVVKLGIDLCTALELCHSKNIMHRDIKPANIFVNELGDFKLGDFGIARTLEMASSGFSQKGTVAYVAPEVMYSNDYTKSVDIYSLGLVLYQLANNNRLPFLPAQGDYTHTMQNDAIKNRLRGDVFPPACNADGALNSILKIACEYEPGNRFQSAEQIKTALEDLNKGGTPFLKNELPTVNIGRSTKNEQSKSDNKLITVVAALFIVAVIMVIAIFAIIAFGDEGEDKPGSESEILAEQTWQSDEKTENTATETTTVNAVTTERQPVSAEHKTNPGYSRNYTAYLKNPSDKTRVYISCGIMSDDHWISGNDPVTIHEVYTDGCCLVSYITDSGITRTYLAKIADFTATVKSDNSSYGTLVEIYPAEDALKYYQECREIFITDSGNAKIAFVPKSYTVREFRIVGLEMGDTIGNYKLTDVLYDCGDLEFDCPVVTEVYIGDVFSHVGIAYVDGNGKTRIHQITYNMSGIGHPYDLSSDISDKIEN